MCHLFLYCKALYDLINNFQEMCIYIFKETGFFEKLDYIRVGKCFIKGMGVVEWKTLERVSSAFLIKCFMCVCICTYVS